MFEESPREPLDNTVMTEDAVTESLPEEPRIRRPEGYDQDCEEFFRLNSLSVFIKSPQHRPGGAVILYKQVLIPGLLFGFRC